MPGTDLKYQQELSLIPNCPPAEVRGVERLAFRFVFEGPNERNYTPPAGINPGRKFENDEEKCDAYGLSLFLTQEHARAFYLRKSVSYKGFKKTIGTHIAQCEIAEDDGPCTAPDGDGHFSLFQATSCELAERLQIVEVLG